MSGSVTEWITGAGVGDHAAAQRLWEKYYDRLVRLARTRLSSSTRRLTDEEDVALSAFDSVFRGMSEGRFPHLSDRNDLWRLLVVVTARKAINSYKRLGRQKRGGGKVRGESFLRDIQGGGDPGDISMDQIIGREPSPEFASMVAESLSDLVTQLDDDRLRKIAIMKIEGYSHAEIAERLHCSTKTVERKVQIIRVWLMQPQE